MHSSLLTGPTGSCCCCNSFIANKFFDWIDRWLFVCLESKSEAFDIPKTAQRSTWVARVSCCRYASKRGNAFCCCCWSWPLKKKKLRPRNRKNEEYSIAPTNGRRRLGIFSGGGIPFYMRVPLEPVTFRVLPLTLTLISAPAEVYESEESYIICYKRLWWQKIPPVPWQFQRLSTGPRDYLTALCDIF